MLDQEKIGKYIAEKRKALGITQKQLADQVGLTDKAVSKWERGKSIPDHAVMHDLCDALGISVNEFLSGEDIVLEEYSDRAEENMMALIEEKKRQMRRSRMTGVCLCVGFILILTGVCALIWGTYGNTGLIRFIDLPSLLFVIGITVTVSVAAGTVRDLFKAFPILADKEVDNGQMKKTLYALKLAILTNLIGGGFYFVSQMILMLPPLTDIEEVFAVISLTMLPVWYGLLLDLFLIPVYFRLQNRKEQKS